ncbi:hypothetical protein [Plantactinospora soyae]|uniref:Uncharacterized protein n=1 Tax=Plantactinospora soyae TaxID=1544732 RepID=A0A927QWN7_9ACTN|nr:hypothetical protein [Plantactinospora soyae]MBE1487125.1 hypothetical protein [Plantactinospora soyae]
MNHIESLIKGRVGAVQHDRLPLLGRTAGARSERGSAAGEGSLSDHRNEFFPDGSPPTGIFPATICALTLAVTWSLSISFPS